MRRCLYPIIFYCLNLLLLIWIFFGILHFFQMNILLFGGHFYLQPALSQDYSSYQSPLLTRGDQSGLGYSPADPSKYRSDPIIGQNQQQQPLAHLSQQPYAGFMYTQPNPYGYAAQAPVYQQPNIPSGYGKTSGGGGSLNSNYPGGGGAYQDVSSLSEKVSSPYASNAGLRGFGGSDACRSINQSIKWSINQVGIQSINQIPRSGKNQIKQASVPSKHAVNQSILELSSWSVNWRGKNVLVSFVYMLVYYWSFSLPFSRR